MHHVHAMRRGTGPRCVCTGRLVAFIIARGSALEAAASRDDPMHRVLSRRSTVHKTKYYMPTLNSHTLSSEGQVANNRRAGQICGGRNLCRKKKALYARERPARALPLFPFSLQPPLHNSAADSALLGRIRVVLLVNVAPDRWHHEVLRAIRVGNNAVDNALVNCMRS